MNLVKQLIAQLKTPNKCPSAADLRDLSYEIHSAQVNCAAPELIWMSSSFEDMGDVLTTAINNEVAA